MEKPVPVAVTICEALSIPRLYPGYKRVMDVLLVVFFRIIEGVMKAVLRNFPRFGERRFAQLGDAIDVNEVGGHPADNIARRPVN